MLIQGWCKWSGRSGFGRAHILAKKGHVHAMAWEGERKGSREGGGEGEREGEKKGERGREGEREEGVTYSSRMS